MATEGDRELLQACASVQAAAAVLAFVGLAVAAAPAAALQAGAPPEPTHLVGPNATPCLSLRPSPGLAGQPWDCLSPGTVAALLDSEGDWSRIRLTDGRVGWVATAYLVPVTAPGEVPSAEPPPAAPPPPAALPDGAAAGRVAADLELCRAERDDLLRQLETMTADEERERELVAAREAMSVLQTRVEAARAAAPPVAAETIVPAEPLREPVSKVRVEVPLSAPAGAPAAPPEPLPDLERIVPMVEAWASAWSGQRVEQYLSFYSRDFRPPTGMTRQEWEAQRRQRLTAPRSIEIELAAIGQRPLADGRASVRFSQTYRSDAFTDVVLKTLDLVWEDGGWKILEEMAEAQP